MPSTSFAIISDKTINKNMRPAPVVELATPTRVPVDGRSVVRIEAHTYFLFLCVLFRRGKRHQQSVTSKYDPRKLGERREQVLNQSMRDNHELGRMRRNDDDDDHGHHGQLILQRVRNATNPHAVNILKNSSILLLLCLVYFTPSKKRGLVAQTQRSFWTMTTPPPSMHPQHLSVCLSGSDKHFVQFVNAARYAIDAMLPRYRHHGDKSPHHHDTLVRTNVLLCGEKGDTIQPYLP